MDILKRIISNTCFSIYNIVQLFMVQKNHIASASEESAPFNATHYANVCKKIIESSEVAEHAAHLPQATYRIFVNRSLHMEKIKFFGFDMDYTLAFYKSPDYEILAFNIIRDRLVEIGYPKEISSFQYDPSFPVRGIWFDMEYGTILKVDSYGNIFLCVKGFQFLNNKEIRRLYPNKFMLMDESRIYVMNTLFNLPEMYILACVIHWFNINSDYIKTDCGIKKGSIAMSYRCIFQDVRAACDWMHTVGGLKTKTVEQLEKYVQLDDRLPMFLDRLRLTGAKTFLLTNSDYSYSDKIMTYILSLPDASGFVRPWTSYFDYIVVSAQKPKFFTEGTLLKSVDMSTGTLSLGRHMGPLKTGRIYSGGSCEAFSELIGARGKDVLYIGDHIFGDILKSKKIVGWRTYLVLPELANEIYVWKSEKALFDTLQELDFKLSEAYKNLNISSDIKPDLGSLRQQIKDTADKMEKAYGGLLGSLFRNGTRHTFFSSQVLRYADLYSSSCLNLIHYPLFYMFRSRSMLMPHEATVSHNINDFEDVRSILIESAKGPCRKGNKGIQYMYEPSLSRSKIGSYNSEDSEVNLENDKKSDCDIDKADNKQKPGDLRLKLPSEDENISQISSDNSM